MCRNRNKQNFFTTTRTVISYVLLVTFLEVQRSSSETAPFDNPFWVEWLRESKRIGSFGSSRTSVTNKGTSLSHPRIFDDLSSETVPLLRPVLPQEKANIIEKGEVFSAPTRTQTNKEHVNEHTSFGQASIQKTIQADPQLINQKPDQPIFTAFSPLNHIPIDDQSEIFTRQSVAGKRNIFEENRSSLNTLPVNIINTNDFDFSSKQLLQQLSVSSLSNSNDDDQVFLLDEDSVDDHSKFPFFNGVSKTAALKNRASFFPISARPVSEPIPTTTSAPSSTTETTPYSTTTRTLVASWPVVRSRNIGKTRAANRFRSRVPISSPRKAERRVKKISKRRQVFKRRRQTPTPQITPRTTLGPSNWSTSSIASILQNVDTIKTTQSTTSSSSTTTTISTTTAAAITTTRPSTSTMKVTSIARTSTQTTSTPTTPSPTVPPTTSAATFVYTNLRTASALVVTRNVTSTRVVTAPIAEFLETEDETTFAPTTEMTLLAKIGSLPTDVSDQKGEIEGMHKKYFEERDNLSRTVGRKHLDLEPTTTEQAFGIVDYDTIGNEESFIARPSNIKTVKVEDPGVRSPRLTDSDWQPPQQPFEPADSDWQPPQQPFEPATQNILSGQYHEINPGQYHETNPGQYHETDPGQYHENNPGQPIPALQEYEEYKEYEDEVHAGQYHETNPGQYHEVNPGQYHEVNPGQYISDTSRSSSSGDNSEHRIEVVGVEHTDDAKVYNVQQRVDDFIIGEYGTISKTSGQTLNGVRYTAVADDRSGLDPNFIYETLVKYFGIQRMAEAKTAPTS